MYWRLLRLILGAFTILLVFSIALPQQGNMPKAENAKTITVYTSLPVENILPTIREFEKRTGVKVLYVSLPEQEILPRLRTEKAVLQADVWVGGTLESMLAAKKEGLLQQYATKRSEEIPVGWQDKDGMWTAIYADIPVLVSNKDMHGRQGDAPNSWQDLTENRYKNKIAFADPGVSNASYTMMAAQQQNLGADKAVEFYTQLHRNIQQYPKTASAPGRMVAMGEMSTGVLGASDAIRYIRDGFPLVLTLPKENPGYQLYAAALLAGAPHSEEAQQFIDWLISAEGQALLCSTGFHYYPSNVNVKPVPELAPLKDIDLTTFNPIDAAENRIKFIEKWNVDIRMGRINT